MHRLKVCTAFVIALLLGCDQGGSSSSQRAAPASTSGRVAVVALQAGADVQPAVRRRIEALLRRSAQRGVEVRPPGDDLSAMPAGSLVIALGDTHTTRDLISAADRDAQGSEGFVVRSRQRGGVTWIAADGNGPSPDPYRLGVNRGLLYGAYALLEELGFAFLHPLAPTVPAGLVDPGVVDLRQAPHWPHRGWHLHTMHPLELTELLNGWGQAGPNDAAGWRSMLGEWETFCEWAIANRQNEVEWVLLMARSWQAFAGGPVRQRRLKELVGICHAWGLAAGADAPLALRQQHSWTMIRQTGALADEVAQIHSATDYLMGADFDFVSTELGFSEFTTPDDRRMLAWLDALTDYTETRHGKHTFTKVHVSQGQEAPNFTDPVTGGPLNFNFLPHYADPRLGVLPHTVQHYGLTDPAPTYGATDFDFIRQFLHQQAGARRTIFYPETAYWVSFDVDVPLFLPLYAERRLSDLRLLAEDERMGRMGRGVHAGARMDGQMVFSSGWEWGYWLNDVVAARAAWDPQPAHVSETEALRRALAPVVRPFGPASDSIRDLLVTLMRDQRELLIEGKVNGQRPSTVHKRNGQAYLQGWETWDEVMALGDLFNRPALTQPAKMGLVDMRTPWLPNPDYLLEVRPLLAAMATRFTASADGLLALASQVPPHARDLYDDLVDSARMTALRARQVLGLYDYVWGQRSSSPQAWSLSRLNDARDALDQAQRVVVAREPRYRVPADRIAGWRDNPTPYPYNYLWTARSLHFWWRDEGKAVDAPRSPAYLNIVDPLDVAFGEGFWIPLSAAIRWAGAQLGLGGVTNLLGSPAVEPTYPQDNLRSRP